MSNSNIFYVYKHILHACTIYLIGVSHIILRKIPHYHAIEGKVYHTRKERVAKGHMGHNRTVILAPTPIYGNSIIICILIDLTVIIIIVYIDYIKYIIISFNYYIHIIYIIYKSYINYILNIYTIL
jgi:hypothetical protein